jgi:P4 family phage/plasmid primase-like protien
MSYYKQNTTASASTPTVAIPTENLQKKSNQQVKYNSEILKNELPKNTADAAHWWLEFGLKVIPISPQIKIPVCKWQPWLDKLNHNTISEHWLKRTEHDVGAVIDHTLLVLDADTKDSLAALYALEKEFDKSPNLIVKTKKGEHHFFKRAPFTYAIMKGYSTTVNPKKIDIKTGRSELAGRSIIVLAPSTNKKIVTNEADNADDLTEVDQAFIDAVFKHNGEDPPRLPEPKIIQEYSNRAGKHEVSEILSYISADLDYDDWLKVLMGVHAHFNGADIGLHIVDSWSATGINYDGVEGIENRWRSFSTGGGITFASVCDMATKAGAELALIKKKYDQNGDPHPTFEDLKELAINVDRETPTDEINLILNHAKILNAIDERRIKEMLKKNTGLTFEVLNQAQKENAPTEIHDDHLSLAKKVVEYCDSKNVIAVNSFIWGWNDLGVWEKLEDRTIKKVVINVIPELTDDVSKNIVDGVTDVFKTLVFRPQHEFDIGHSETVNCLNGELQLDAAASKWKIVAHRRESYRTTQIPVSFRESLKAPLFEKFLNDIFEGATDSQDRKLALLEMMGYTLMAHCEHEKFIILVGAGANGKSVLLSVLEALCGSKNVAGVQPSKFGNTFQRAHLHTKLANIVTEIEQGEVIADAALKGIVSGEPSTVEHKFKNPFEMRPFATCWFGTNHMPHTKDFSDALFRRALIIKFENIFKPELGNCDPKLKHKLLKELPGILNMSLDAYAKALKDGFTMPTSSAHARQEWRLEADQVAQFVDESCEQNVNYEVTISDLFITYQDWADSNGISRKLGKKGVRDRLTRLGYGETRTSAARYVTGLKLCKTYGSNSYSTVKNGF